MYTTTTPPSPDLVPPLSLHAASACLPWPPRAARAIFGLRTWLSCADLLGGQLHAKRLRDAIPAVLIILNSI